MTEINNPALLDDLRTKIRNGASAIEATRLLIDRLHLGPESRLVVIAYFRAAFGMQLHDASKLGAWEFFTGGTWPEAAVNDEVNPILLDCLRRKQ